MKNVTTTLKVFLTNQRSISDNVNFLGVMPGPTTLSEYMFFHQFTPDGNPYEIKYIQINTTEVEND